MATIIGSSANETLTGTNGDDVITGAGGNDTLSGLGGNDVFLVNLNDGFDSFSGGDGTDTIRATADKVAIGLMGNFANAVEVISAGGKAGVTIQGDWTSQTLDFSATTLDGISAINGGDGNDTITGSAAADVIIGGSGNDTLNGSGGNDTFRVGGADGFDSFTGGDGTDSVIATADGAAIGLMGNYANGVETFSSGGKASVTILGDWTSQVLDFSTTVLDRIVAINGGDGNDTITGSAAADVIIGGSGNDTLNGGGGNDTFRVGASDGFDSFTGGDGTDTVTATADGADIGLMGNYANGVEVISSGGKVGVAILGDWTSQSLDFTTTTLDGIVAIDGGDGNDTITGSAASDVIIGGSGNDTLAGGGGDDVFEVGKSHGFDSFSGGDGTDIVRATAHGTAIGLMGNYANSVESFSGSGKAGVTIQGDWTSQTLDFSATTLDGISAINGGDGNDTITGSAAADVIIGGSGNDTLNGSRGDDEFRVGRTDGFDSFNGGDGADSVVATADGTAIGLMGNYANTVESFSSGGKVGVTIQGDWTSQSIDFSTTTLVGIDAINGGDGNDTITGSAAADVIIGGSGNDTLNGSGGNDTFRVGASDGFDAFNGGDGADTVQAADDNVAIGLMGNYANGVETFSAAGFSGVTIQGDWTSQSLDFSATTLDGIASVHGGDGNDTITGSVAGDVLIGGSGNDTVRGFDGDDTVIGGSGADRLDGGAGIDTADYSASAAGVTVSLVVGAVNTGGDAQGDQLSTIENLVGSALADALTGDLNANLISGGGGNDTISAGGGDDVLRGGAGADQMTGGDGFDTADYSLSETGVQISLGGAAGVGGDAQGDRLSGIERIVGSALADVLGGTAGASVLDGGEGDDVLVGGSSDTLIGGAGFDTADYSASATGVTIVMGGVSSTGDSFSGIERVLLTALADTATGDAGDNILSGQAGADTLDGAGGADQLDGGLGDDRLTGGAGADALTGGAGTDTADYRNSASGVTVDLGANTASGGDAAGDSFSGIENLSGSNNNDVLTGNSGVNRLTGLQGADQLNGGGGNDVLDGGSGGDALNGGDGTDTAEYSDSWGGVTVDLAAGIGSGAAAAGDTYVSIENVWGSAHADKITGSDADNRLTGGNGADTLDGGNGNDTLVGGSGADKLIGGAGTQDAADYQSASSAVTVNLVTGGTLGAAAGDSYSGVEFVYGSRFNDTITGNGDVNRLTGGAGNDALNGEGGNDYLVGGAGADQLNGGAGADVFCFDGVFGSDTITDFWAGAGRTDRVWLTNVGVNDFAGVLAHATDGVDGVTLHFDGRGDILLAGVTIANLAADDFIF